MFIGHFGIGFGSKAAAPGASLGSLFLASQFIDLLWPTLLVLGIERVNIVPGATKVTPLEFAYYPISHSLLAVLFWALLVAGIYHLLRRYPRGTLVLGLAVVSHWVLDAVVHRPDLPLYPGSSYLVGFGLWSSLWGTIVIELLIFGIGVGLYLRTTEAVDNTGVWAFWILVVLLIFIYLGNVFGSPPPNVTALAWIGEAQWILILWGYWIDRHRRIVEINGVRRTGM